jgi:DNA-directed RNA polymerase specialized sigma24 family protein
MASSAAGLDVTQMGRVRHRFGVEGSCTLEEAYGKWSGDLVMYATALVGSTDAPDLVADTFAVLIRRGDERWAEVRNARAYLFRSVTNSARMLVRSRSRRHERERAWPPVVAHGELLRDPAVIAALAQLSVRQRAAVFLTYWEDLGTAEVARRMDVSEGAVKRHLARGRSVLREVLA